MRKLASVVACCAIFFAQGGCGTGKDVTAAEEHVTNFHRQLDSQGFLDIYNQADPKLKEITKSEEFVGLLTAVHKKLGNVQNATRQGFYVNFSTSGSTVRVTYETKFTEGQAQEVFTWKKSGNDLRLLGYNIQSNALILK